MSERRVNSAQQPSDAPGHTVLAARHILRLVEDTAPRETVFRHAESVERRWNETEDLVQCARLTLTFSRAIGEKVLSNASRRYQSYKLHMFSQIELTNGIAPMMAKEREEIERLNQTARNLGAFYPETSIVQFTQRSLAEFWQEKVPIAPEEIILAIHGNLLARRAARIASNGLY